MLLRNGLVFFFMAGAIWALASSALAGLSLDPARPHTVRVELPGHVRMLNLSEVEVWSGGENVALGAAAEMVRGGPPEMGPGILTDGKTSGKLADGDVAHTYWQEAPWIEVPLAKGIGAIDRIVVWNRWPEGMEIASRTLPLKASVRDARDKTIWEETLFDAPVQTKNEADQGDTRHQKFEFFPGRPSPKQPAAPAKPRPFTSQPLFDKGRDSGEAWITRMPGAVEMETVAKDTALGEPALAVRFRGAAEWAQISLTAEGSPGATEAFERLRAADSDRLVFPLHNPGKSPATLIFKHGKELFSVTIPPGSVARPAITRRQIADAHGASSGGLREVTILAQPGQGDIEVRFGAPRLECGDTTSGEAARALATAKERARRTGADRFVLGVESAMRPVFPERGRYVPRFEESAKLAAAGGERESFQVVVAPYGGALRDVRWRVEPPRDKAGRVLAVGVRVVGYVQTQPVQYVEGSEGGWYPDLLVAADSVPELAADTHLALWVTAGVPRGAAPGRYSGRITVAAAGAKPQALPFEVEVLPFDLPVRPGLKMAFALADSAPAHGLPKIYPEDQTAPMRAAYENLILGEFRADVNNIYRTGAPWHWDANRLRELKAMGITGFCLGYFPEDPRQSTEPDIDKRIADVRNYLAVVDEAGVRDMCYFYGFDESSFGAVPSLIETAGRLKREFPDIAFLTTATAFDGGKGALEAGAEVVDWWCVFSSGFYGSPQTVADVAARAPELWFYVCNVSTPPQPNIHVEQPPATVRQLSGSIPRKLGVDGLLYWALNSWSNNALPADTGRLPFVRWNPNTFNWPNRLNGEGCLVAAGKDGPIPTIRLAMLRDGLDDFDYHQLASVSGVPDADTLARVPDTVVRSIALFTTDPEAIEAERSRIADILKHRILNKTR